MHALLIFPPARRNLGGEEGGLCETSQNKMPGSEGTCGNKAKEQR